MQTDNPEGQPGYRVIWESRPDARCRTLMLDADLPDMSGIEPDPSTPGME